MLLSDALKEVAIAFARNNKTAAASTLATIERQLIARTQALPGVLIRPVLRPKTRARLIARLANAMSAAERAVEGVALHREYH